MKRNILTTILVATWLCAGLATISEATPRVLRNAIKRAGTAKILAGAKYTGPVPMNDNQDHPGFAASVTKLDAAMKGIAANTRSLRVEKRRDSNGGAWLHQVTAVNDVGREIGQITVRAHRWLWLPRMFGIRSVKVELPGGDTMEADGFRDAVSFTEGPGKPGRYTSLIETQNTYERVTWPFLKIREYRTAGHRTVLRFKDNSYELKERWFLSLKPGQLGTPDYR